MAVHGKLPSDDVFDVAAAFAVEPEDDVRPVAPPVAPVRERPLAARTAQDFAQEPVDFADEAPPVAPEPPKREPARREPQKPVAAKPVVAKPAAAKPAAVTPVTIARVPAAPAPPRPAAAPQRQQRPRPPAPAPRPAAPPRPHAVRTWARGAALLGITAATAILYWSLADDRRVGAGTGKVSQSAPTADLSPAPTNPPAGGTAAAKTDDVPKTEPVSPVAAATPSEPEPSQPDSPSAAADTGRPEPPPPAPALKVETPAPPPAVTRTAAGAPENPPAETVASRTTPTTGVGRPIPGVDVARLDGAAIPANAPIAPPPLPPATPPVADRPSASSPASAAPPAPATPTEAAPSAPAINREAEAGKVRALLSRYESAYSGLDADAAARLYPSVDQRALTRAFGALDSQKVTFDDCRIQVGISLAHATCTGTMTWKPKVGGGSKTQARSWQFDLKQVGTDWQIGSVSIK
jgi:hypothetical protein